jgi:hypothetical protein
MRERKEEFEQKSPRKRRPLFLGEAHKKRVKEPIFLFYSL